MDWQLPAQGILNRIRAFTPWPGAFTILPLKVEAGGPPKPGVLLKIWEAFVATETGPPGEILRADKNGIVIGCASESVVITILQREGGRRMTAAEFVAGHPLRAGERLR